MLWAPAWLGAARVRLLRGEIAERHAVLAPWVRGVPLVTPGLCLVWSGLQDYRFPGSQGKQYFLGLEYIFKGSGDCSAVDWTFLGGSIANWSFLCFCGIAVLSALLALTAWRKN